MEAASSDGVKAAVFLLTLRLFTTLELLASDPHDEKKFLRFSGVFSLKVVLGRGVLLKDIRPLKFAATSDGLIALLDLENIRLHWPCDEARKRSG
jgi:hypothetical protein